MISKIKIWWKNLQPELPQQPQQQSQECIEEIPEPVSFPNKDYVDALTAQGVVNPQEAFDLLYYGKASHEDFHKLSKRVEELEEKLDLVRSILHVD